jgi:Flp pilus assembly protein protease CpaA
VDLQSGCALAVAVAACATDLRARRIPNALTLGALAGRFTP